MAQVPYWLTNNSDKLIAVGMTKINPGDTEEINAKDFQRKASYIDRMIKEGKLSFGSAVSDSSTIIEDAETTTVEAPAKRVDEALTSKEDETKSETKVEEKVEAPIEVEVVKAPAQRTK